MESTSQSDLQRFSGDLGTTLEPFGDYVIVQPVDQQLQSKGALITVVRNTVPINRCIVLKTGPDVPDWIKLGDVMQHMVPAKGAAVLFENGRSFAAIPFSQFVARESPEAAEQVRAMVVESGPHPELSRDASAALLAQQTASYS